jgi:hypothetical protein
MKQKQPDSTIYTCTHVKGLGVCDKCLAKIERHFLEKPDVTLEDNIDLYERVKSLEDWRDKVKDQLL